tara:strand:+ start:543 stop:1592 length:1050 start_codon:yes stop_codon:yes gene_type:complete
MTTVLEQAEIVENGISVKPVIAVTMATSRQGVGVVKELSKTNKYQIRAITRDIKSINAVKLSKLNNVEVFKGDLMDPESLNKAFDGADAIFGNTTPTKGWRIFRGSIVRSYEIDQGFNLINQVKIAYQKGKLNHFIFSSISKPKDPLKNDPAPGHFTSKWDIEEYIKKMGLKKITTVLRPVSYFENFENKIPGYTISKKVFPGIVGKDFKWQTIAVEDIGKWVRGILSKSEKYKDTEINIAGEELTGQEMAATLEKLVYSEGIRTSYLMIPRIAIKFLEYDIGVMADWIERSGYGADMDMLKEIQSELNIVPLSLENWLKSKIKNEDNNRNTWTSEWKNSQWKLQLDKQ